MEWISYRELCVRLAFGCCWFVPAELPSFTVQLGETLKVEKLRPHQVRFVPSLYFTAHLS